MPCWVMDSVKTDKSILKEVQELIPIIQLSETCVYVVQPSTVTLISRFLHLHTFISFFKEQKKGAVLDITTSERSYSKLGEVIIHVVPIIQSFWKQYYSSFNLKSRPNIFVLLWNIIPDRSVELSSKLCCIPEHILLFSVLYPRI